MGWEKSGRCHFRGRGKKTRSEPTSSPPAAPKSEPSPPPPPPPTPNVVEERQQDQDVVYYTVVPWNEHLKHLNGLIPSPPLKIQDDESGEVTVFKERLVPFEKKPANPRSPAFWLKTREDLNPDFQLKPVGRGENPFHVIEENQTRFMQMNDISLENFSCATPRNLHLWQQRPAQWLPRTKDFWCWW